MKNYLIIAIILMQFNASLAQKNKNDSVWVKDLSEVVVKSTRANAKTAMAYSDVLQKDIKKQNLGQDMPFLLNQMPSVVVTSDAGTGIGYTGIRVRGSDPTRINVTLNGIPYNDSESQGVYWVNMPDFASSVQSVQIQRGLGTSTNGAGAFGASINVNTLQLHTEPFAEINTSIGSFNTLKTNIIATTGLLQNKFVLDTRLSKINSDGFVDRAASDLRSYYISGGYYGKNSFLRLNVFGGNEKTYQSWNGIPEALAKNDLAGINDFVERNYYDEDFKKQMLERGRKFNFYSYENEIDDYTQTHIQLITSWKIASEWRFNPTLHYTRGSGFYEQFKSDADFADYGLQTIKIGNTEIASTDLIRRKWLYNDFYGGVWSLDYEGQGKVKGNLGGGWNKYDGDHFGEIIWAKYASNSDIRQRFYDNTGQKTDFNLYGKLFFDLNANLSTYLDLQIRNVHFEMLGTGDARQTLDYSKKYNFFNPKAGLTYQLSGQKSLYISYAKGSKEPSRQDFVDNAPNLPKAEKLHDFEGGYRFFSNKFSAETNLYYMLYQDQLVLTGQINQVGEAIRTNVDHSYRAGIELQASLKLNANWNIQANATLSQNKIRDYAETIVSYDDSPNIVNKFKKSDISFSPNTIMGGTVTLKPVKSLEISLLPKYVGKQYLDNSGSELKKLDGYFVNDLRANYTLHPKNLKEIGFSLLINNILNKKYESNGYTYSYIYEKTITENFVFPQAGINFLMGISVKI
ncbi:MAG: TonB-dependent receptor [Spirosomataceae bacterium]